MEDISSRDPLVPTAAHPSGYHPHQEHWESTARASHLLDCGTYGGVEGGSMGTGRITSFTREGLVFDVRDAGPVDGTPVFLLHGFPQDSLRSLTALSVPHPAAFIRAMHTSSQRRKSRYMLFFQLPWLPERQLTSGKSWERSLRSTGMSPEAAARDAGRMSDRGAARGALNWYRAMMFSSPRALRAKITVPTLYVWSDGDKAIGPQGAALTPCFVAGPYTYEVLDGVSHWIPEEAPEQLDALLARHFDAVPANGD